MAEEVVVRVLPPEEYHLLQGVHLFAHLPLPDREHFIPVVVQEVKSSRIVGYWFVFDAVHVEPLWIDEEYRKRPGIARRLWKGVQAELERVGAPMAFACIADQDAAQNLPQATRLGFRRVPGGLYFIEVRPENAEEVGWKSAVEIVAEAFAPPPDAGKPH